MIARALVVSFVVACGGTAPAPAPIIGHTPDPEPAAPAPAPATREAIVVVYGRMSYVMDSPRGQQDKAEAAVKRSALASEFAVTFRFDEHAGDDVIVQLPSGEELARVPLHELDAEGATVVARVREKIRLAANPLYVPLD